MSDISCSYTGDREQSLIAYLYEEIDPAERTLFSLHLAGCERCRRDLAALGGVRQQLAKWSPPEPQVAEAQRRGATGRRASRWREIPGWAQAAAALLLLGASAGLANLDVRYDAAGLSVRTGWSKPAHTAAARTVAPDAVSRSELTALEQQLQNEIQAIEPPPARATTSDAELLRRVRALVDESEKRQQRELALRVAQVVRDVGAQRQVDLSNIDRNLGVIQNKTGVEILRQREMVNYLMRVSQKQ